MKNYFCIADRFYIVISTYLHGNFSQYILQEYHDYYTADATNDIPTLGYVKELSENLYLDKCRELVKDWLYENENHLYLKYNGTFIRIGLETDYFELCFQKNIECQVLFHVMEVLIRLYSYKCGIDFFHASSFKYIDNVIMLNGFGGSGKTEIMVNFLLRGANFISDDLCIINENADIYPYTVSIPVNWTSINQEFLGKIKVPSYIYNICSYCKKKNGRITRRIYSRLASKYLLGYYSHKQLTDNDTEMKFYKVNEFIWLQGAYFQGAFTISNEQFFRYMNLCLENESRKYFDLEGFLVLKYPFIKSFITARQELRERICSKINIKAVAVKNRNYKIATQDLLS